MSSNSTDLFKTSAKRGRTSCNSIASRYADGMNTHQVRTKSTDGANLKNGRRKSVVRDFCGTLKCMVLDLEGCFIGCTYRSDNSTLISYGS